MKNIVETLMLLGCALAVGLTNASQHQHTTETNPLSMKVLYLEDQLYWGNLSRTMPGSESYKKLTLLLQQHPEIASINYKKTENYSTIPNMMNTGSIVLRFPCAIITLCPGGINIHLRRGTIVTLGLQLSMTTERQKITTLPVSACEYGATGFFEQILKEAIELRPCLLPGNPRNGSLRVSPAYPFLLAYIARNTQPELLKELETKCPTDIAKLILEFTPDTARTVQKYRENGKSLLDVEIEELSQTAELSGINNIHSCHRNIDMLIKAGVPTIHHATWLQEYKKERIAQKKRRTLLIAAGACIAGVAGLAYWWFSKK